MNEKGLIKKKELLNKPLTATTIVVKKEKCVSSFSLDYVQII